jgi:hypothetical protein
MTSILPFTTDSKLAGSVPIVSASAKDCLAQTYQPPKVISTESCTVWLSPASRGTGSGLAVTTDVHFADTSALTLEIESNTRISLLTRGGEGTVAAIVLTPNGWTEPNSLALYTYL